MDPTYHGLGAPVPTNYRGTRGGPSRKSLFLIIAGVLVVIIAAVLLFSSRDTTGALQSRLSARLGTLQKIVAEGQKNIKDPDLQRINSDISIQVLSDATSIGIELKAAGLEEVDEATTESEADIASFNTLRDAALNDRFDDAYRKLIAQKLDSTNALIKELYDKSSNASLRSSLNAAYGHFNTLQTQLAADTNS